MNIKKVIMIIVLLLFIVFLAVIIININSTSTEKLSKQNTVNQTNTGLAEIPSVSVDGKNVRVSTQDATPDLYNITEIKDNFFIEQTNDIYINLDEYIGKTIKMQGFVYTYENGNGEVCYGVVRNTPGCCGADGLAGLDIRYNGEYPEVKKWVEVVGVIGTDTVWGSTIPIINVATIEEKPEGVTFVTN